ncbi:MAG: hypothetical protein AAF503_08175 [Pseudomonadota bacterium]
MSSGPIETYRPRAINSRGTWDFDGITFKVYDLLAEGRTVNDEMIGYAKAFVSQEVLPRSESMGDSNGLGFVIIHPGDLGLTIAAHWWAQGSVLCQHIYRRQYDDARPLDTINRPAVACVWELEIITAEQAIWRETMMNNQSDSAAYLEMRAPEKTA